MLEVPIRSRSDVGKLRIAQGLESLLRDHTIEEVNVTQVCKAADISRQTFYRHFKDKYDIVQWVWKSLSERYVKEIGRTLTWEEASIGICRASASSTIMLTNMMAPSGDYQALPAYMERTIIAWFEQTTVEYHNAVLTQKLRFEIRFAVAGIMRVMPCARPGNQAISPRDYASCIKDCIPRELYELFTPVE